MDATQVYTRHEMGTFDWKDLHGKAVMIHVYEPTDSDLAEGNLATEVTAVDRDQNVYVIQRNLQSKETKI